MMNEPKTADQMNAPFVGKHEWRGTIPPAPKISPRLECGRGITFEFHVWASADAKEGDPCKCGKVKWAKLKS